MKYNHSILGGSFDRLHDGHKSFISRAANSSQNLTIGLVTDKFLGNRIHKDIIESFSVRRKNLEQYLKENGWLEKTNIIPLNDIFGNTLRDETVDAVFVIDESVDNAKEINFARKEKGMPELKIEVVPMTLAADSGFISSKRIRNGELDRNGNSYLQLFERDLILPERLRDELKKPFGNVLTESSLKNIAAKKIITIGDITTQKFIELGIIPNLSIYDLKTDRQEIKDDNIIKFLPEPTHTVVNLPGEINNNAVLTINQALHEDKNISIMVDGEEDLLTIPAILLSPLNNHVIYGIHDLGAIDITVTEEKKAEVEKILKGFTHN